MTNEAILVQDLEFRHLQVVMADGSSGSDVEKGTILKMADANLAAAGSSDGDFFHGVLLTENVGGDGTTRYAVSRYGVWAMKLTAATVSAGEPVKMAGTNLIAKADDDTIANKGEIVGLALQDGANNEVIEILVGGV